VRIVVAHDHYRSSAPSGEDAVFRNEWTLLERNGHAVIPFERFNDDIDENGLGKRIRLALDGAWSKRTYADLSKLLRRTRPDLAHFHNTFPLISPSAYAACRDSGVPVVQTLHNYRLVCAGALLTRKGQPCEACLGTTLLPALRHRCYRGSAPATAAVVWMLASNRARAVYRTLVDRYIALTRFAASRFAAGGLPSARIEVKPNFLPDAPAPGRGDGEYAVYVGRLSEEKGVRTLIEAWRSLGAFPLKIVGEGPLRHELESRARDANIAVEFLGFRPQKEVLDVVGRAALQVVPSECYEGFPMVVLEAYASGTPVVASRLGSLDEIVVESRSGVKFESGNAGDLAAKLAALLADRQTLQAMRETTRRLFDEQYTAGANYTRLLDIYEAARQESREAIACAG
jgi:glycosyltransferase involved in cell wall biosynthesis